MDTNNLITRKITESIRDTYRDVNWTVNFFKCFFNGDPIVGVGHHDG